MEPEEEAQEPYFDLFDRLIEEMVNQSPVQRGAELVREFAANYAEYAHYVETLLLSPPATILVLLAMLSPDYADVKDLPNAASYLEDLQAILKA